MKWPLRTILLRWLAAAGWMALIFYVSAQPKIPRFVGRWDHVQDIAGHFLAYAVLALLLRWALAATGARHGAWWALAIAVAYGLSDEAHQFFVPGRHADPWDLLTDAAGAGVSLALAAWVAVRRARRRAGRRAALAGSR